MPKNDPITWTTETRRLGDLRPWEGNPRQTTKEQAERLKRSLRKFDYSQLYEIEPDNTILDGHQRDALMQLMTEWGENATIEVRVASRKFTLDERKEYIALKHQGAQGEWNWEAMHNLYLGDELLDFGFAKDDLELHGFEWNDDNPPDDPGAEMDKADALREKWGVSLGDLWVLGDHRLICGDCTDAEVMERVMGGERADIGLHDPPYGIDAPNMTLGLGKKEFLREDFDKEKVDISHLLGASEICIIWGGNYYSDVLPITNDWLCWDKKNSDRSYSEFELAWSNIGNNCRIINHHWSGEEKIHPTQKPLPVIEWCLSLVEGMIIVDYYLGSGTTLIACERLNRKCRAVEISPAYVAVALERWSQMTSQEPELVTE